MFKNYPSGFTALFCTEVCLNFSFYGLKSIFVLYALAQYGLNEKAAIGLFATLMTLSYGLSILGGWLADRFLGTKNSIIMGALLFLGGLALFGLKSLEFCMLSLALLSLGCGLYKPNLSAAVGQLYKDPQDPEKDKAYSTLYIAMNMGSFAGPVLSGYLYMMGAQIFSLYLFVILIGVMSLVWGWKERTPIARREGNLFIFGCLPLLIGLLYFLIKYQTHMMGVLAVGSVLYLGRVYYKSPLQDKKNLLNVILYIILFSLFCALFEQAGSSILLFINKVVDRSVLGFEIPASAYLSIEPVFVVMLSPLLILYVKGEGLEKMMVGFLLTGLSFFILGLGCLFSAEKVSGLWVFSSILVQACSELLVVPVGFSSVSKLSPKHLQGVMMSFWMMAIAYGHYMGGNLAGFSVSEGSSLPHYSAFFMSTGLLPCVIVGLVYLYFGMKKKGYAREAMRGFK
jgi:POT family proton-dependent oligopeptide transporter